MTAHDPWFAASAILSATLVHEDLATIAAGIAVAGGMVGADAALPSLYIGILMGDLALYGIGRLLALHHLPYRLMNARRLAAFKAWLHGRLMLGVFVVRFLPGLRLSAYVVFGFFAMPVRRFVASDALATIIWTTGLFSLSYEFGNLTAQWLGFWRWPAILLALGMPILLIRHLTRSEASPAAAGQARIDQPV
jgi:membrane protein DedA with SNARE-associated domain